MKMPLKQLPAFLRVWDGDSGHTYKRGHLTERRFWLWDLAKEVVLDLPLVSMVGQDEVTVENHKGLLEYSAETIRIATGAGRLLLTGEGLELKQMSAACIVVKGRIFRLEFLR